MSPLTTSCTAANISSMLVPIFMAFSGTSWCPHSYPTKTWLAGCFFSNQRNSLWTQRQTYLNRWEDFWQVDSNSEVQYQVRAERQRLHLSDGWTSEEDGRAQKAAEASQQIWRNMFTSLKIKWDSLNYSIRGLPLYCFSVLFKLRKKIPGNKKSSVFLGCGFDALSRICFYRFTTQVSSQVTLCIYKNRNLWKNSLII